MGKDPLPFFHQGRPLTLDKPTMVSKLKHLMGVLQTLIIIEIIVNLTFFIIFVTEFIYVVLAGTSVVLSCGGNVDKCQLTHISFRLPLCLS
jgi:hypothetical protein